MNDTITSDSGNTYQLVELGKGVTTSTAFVLKPSENYHPETNPNGYDSIEEDAKREEVDSQETFKEEE